MRRTWGLGAVCVLALGACNAEKRQMTEHLAMLEHRQAVLSQRVHERAREITESERRLDTLKGNLTAHNTEVHTFIANHKIAAACIRASRASWSSDNSFSDEVSATSRFGAAVCGVALLNGEFAREVAYVTQKLAEADARVKELNEQMDSLRRAIENDRTELHRDQNAADGIGAEMADVRRRLSGE